MTAQDSGSGVLVWFRPATAVDSTGALKGRYGLRARGDTSAGRAAFASVRYMVGQVAHGLNLDSGSAELGDTTSPLAARLEGMGLEPTIAQQVDVVARFEGLRVTDSTPCGRAP